MTICLEKRCLFVLFACLSWTFISLCVWFFPFGFEGRILRFECMSPWSLPFLLPMRNVIVHRRRKRAGGWELFGGGGVTYPLPPPPPINNPPTFSVSMWNIYSEFCYIISFQCEKCNYLALIGTGGGGGSNQFTTSEKFGSTLSLPPPPLSHTYTIFKCTEPLL